MLSEGKKWKIQHRAAIQLRCIYCIEWGAIITVPQKNGHVSLSKHQTKHVNVQEAQGNAKLVNVPQNSTTYNWTKKVYWINLKKELSLIGQKLQASNIPGLNEGQIVIKFALENGINVLDLDKLPPNTRPDKSLQT